MSNPVQARGVDHWDEFVVPPFMDCRSSETEGAGNRSMVAAEVLDDIYSSHTRESTAVDLYVNPRRPYKIFSGELMSTLVYGAMGSKNRRHPGRTFNGEVIRELREIRGMSQDRLAALAGTTKANVSKWERSRSYIAISYDMFMELAKALYVPPEDLVRRLSEPTVASPAATAIPGARKRR